MTDNITTWLCNGETGLSSKCMARVTLGRDAEDRSGCVDHPRDPADLNRCIKLVKAAPEVRESFPKIAELSPEWKAVIDNWDGLVAMFHKEAGEDWSKKRLAYKTYEFMQNLFREARK